ncbi:MAG: hypothetical protein BM557_01715 [Flavobacterium sp. MedPE-SWcel]|uniref:nuclear transport factor 2 family protein n=1 Tax=uncultured Flavobacterium sp. TaxID=165435 RepID=UPI000917DB99|nr:nuclear transport factor 2 family protein [uncultured Flavobacterium sp.]OIQ22118.1 MAG: hypothetical protein BM557_01715 [Flavobacterium sp. MedPE-SWcel]
MNIELQVIELENRLITAMQASDIKELDVLISDDLVFTSHTGHIFTKAMDIEAHKSNNVKIDVITTSEQFIKVIDDIAIVSVMKKISGSFFGTISTDTFRFTRVWKFNKESGQVIAAHSSQVVNL